MLFYILKPTSNLSKHVHGIRGILFCILSHQQAWDNGEDMTGNGILCSKKTFLHILFFCLLYESQSWHDTVNCVLQLNCTLTVAYSQGGVCVCGWAFRLCGPECCTLACPPQPAPSPDSHCQSAQMTKSLHVTNASHHTSTSHCFHLFLSCTVKLLVFTLISCSFGVQ